MFLEALLQRFNHFIFFYARKGLVFVRFLMLYLSNFPAACDILSQGATILLSSMNCQNSLHIHSMAASHHITTIYFGQESCAPELELPVVTVDEGINTTDPSTTTSSAQCWLSTYLTPSSIYHVIKDLVLHEMAEDPQWRDTVVFYDKHHGM